MWSPNKFVVSNFRDVADTGKSMVAFTMVKIVYKVIPKDEGAIVNSSTYLLPCRSWLNSANINNSIAHEQIHFDIAEYHRRLFLKRVSQTSAAADIFPSATRAIFRDIGEQKRMMDSEYDKATAVGQNKEEQLRWSNKIAALLIDLQQYSERTITVK